MKELFKILTAVAMLAFSGTLSFGKTVSEHDALAAGVNFLKTRGIQASSANLTTAYIASGDMKGIPTASFYVFNVRGGHSFVMVSADDRVRPILAFSEESSFDMSSLSQAAKDWINGYKNQIIYAIENNVLAKSMTTAAWNQLGGAQNTGIERTTGVAPLLGTLIWNQAPYYNAECPGYGPYQAPTGCIATAMSQVMKYWNWPPVGTGCLSYHCTSYSPTPLTLSANFGNTVYPWSAMPDEVTTLSSPVGLLMFHAGVSVEMEYDTSESGAEVVELQSWRRTQCTEYALKTYFHYKRSLAGVIRNGVTYVGDSIGYIDTMTEAAWITMLQNELNAGRPVIYSGFGAIGGHAWVCDGWEGSAGLFHFNWGWGGTGPNGYYTIDDLAPPIMGIGAGGSTNFNSDQAIIIGIQPDSFPNTPGSLQLAAHLNSMTSTPMPYSTPFSITTRIVNSGAATFTGDFCTQVFDTLGNLVGTIQTISGESIAAGASAPYTFGPSALYAMIPMDYYHVQVMYRPTGTSTWTPVANNGNFVNYTTADVINDTDIALYGNLNITTPQPVVPGAPFTINTRLFNQGTEDFNGTLQAVMINVSTGTSYPVQALTGQTIDTFRHLNVSFSNPSFTAPNGLYALAVQHQYGGSGNFYVTSSDFYENPVLVTVGVNNSVKSTSLEHDVYVFPNPAKDMITVLPQGLSIAKVQMLDITGREVEKRIQPNGKAAIRIPVSDLAPGIYVIRMETTEAETLVKKITIQ